MATYPDGNPGIYPPDPETSVGRFRYLYGDTLAEPYNPDEPGYRNFTELSDSEIETYLATSGDSVLRALSRYYIALAGRAASESKSVKDYDLQVDLTKRSADLLKVAAMWASQADEEDMAAGNDEWVDIVDTGTSGGEFIPELAIPQWGRQYTMGVWRR